MSTRPAHVPLALALALTSACASVPTSAVTDQRLLAVGNLGARSSYEIRTLYAAPEPAPAPAPATRKRPVTPILFYLGVSVAALAGAAAIGTAIGSAVTRRQLDDAYFTDGLTMPEYDAIVQRGDRLSNAAWGLGLTSFAFASMALISYSVDWARCGPLAPARRRATAPPGRCQDSPPK